MPKGRRAKTGGNKTRGRKPLIPEELVATLEKLLQNHPSIKSACILAGIKPDTFYEWTAKADLAGANPIYTAFADRMKKARELGKISTLQIIKDAARGNDKTPADWRAAAWLLERTHSDEFAPREKIDVRGKISHQHAHQHELKSQIVVIMPAAIATPRPLPKQINAREALPNQQPPPA